MVQGTKTGKTFCKVFLFSYFILQIFLINAKLHYIMLFEKVCDVT